MNYITTQLKNTPISFNTAIICLSPYHGGMEIDTYKITKKLSKISNITLIVKSSSFIEKSYKDTLENIGVNVIPINFYKSFSFSLIFNLRSILKNNKIKNVIYFGASELKSLYFSFLNLDINLIIRHGTTKGTSKKDFFHRYIYHKVNYHVAISNHLAKNVQEIIPFGKKSQLKIIYPSLKNINITQNKIPDNSHQPISLLHVGRIVDGKGQLDAIKACDILYKMQRKFTLRLVGDSCSDYSKELILYLKSIPYKDSIIIEPFTLNIDKYYKTSSIFIFPSKGEGFGNSFVEALSYGLVCIAYNNTTFPEFKKLGFDFIVSENRSISSLKKSLQSALQYVEKNRTPIIENILLSQKLFSEDKEISEYMKILR